jgi:hypothetical protein
MKKQTKKKSRNGHGGRRRMTAAAAIMAGMLVLSGCADTVSAASGTSAKAADTAETSTADTSSQDATTAGTDTTAAASADGTAAGTAATQTASTGNESLETLAAESSLYLTGDYSDKDKDTGEGSDAQKLTISGSGQTYTISEAGTYVITGTATDSRIIVDAGDDGNVHLILGRHVDLQWHDCSHICQNSEKLPHNTAGRHGKHRDGQPQRRDRYSFFRHGYGNKYRYKYSFRYGSGYRRQPGGSLRGDLQQERSDHQRQRYADGEGRIQRRDQIKG